MDRAPAERPSEAIVLALHPEPELDNGSMTWTSNVKLRVTTVVSC
jgi:hypothetical protein